MKLKIVHCSHRLIITAFFWLTYSTVLFAQAPVAITGFIADSQTREQLAFATVSIKGTPRGTITDQDGRFVLNMPTVKPTDSLTVTYLGYTSLTVSVAALQPDQTIYLEQSYTLLEAVTISRVAVSAKKIERDLRVIRGSLYAMETEVTNDQYNLFLASLEEQGRLDLLQKNAYDLSTYDKAARTFFVQYTTPYKTRSTKGDTLQSGRIRPYEWGDYPAVNIGHAAAESYCQWLTDQYNNYTGKKKFKRVKFRLPSLDEWRIAALGYLKFQSWTLSENVVDVIIPSDSLDMLPKKGIHKSIPVGHDILYPWFGSFYYRKNPRNFKNCFLGNFKVDYVDRPCPANIVAYDGWSMMGRTATYFPNNMGLYDVVGNVAEMIAENGKACGGSWSDIPAESTIHSVKHFGHPDATIGFRVFMEVIEN